MSKNAMEIHQTQAEDWRVTVVDTGEETMDRGTAPKDSCPPST